MKVRSWLIILAILVAWAPPAFAQVDNGRIAGIVRDSSSALAPGVNVKIKNERTGEERTAVTNDQGYFLVTPLKPSTYTIRVERPGFAPIEYTAMPLAIGQDLTLDFELKPAGVTHARVVGAVRPVRCLVPPLKSRDPRAEGGQKPPVQERRERPPALPQPRP